MWIIELEIENYCSKVKSQAVRLSFHLATDKCEIFRTLALGLSL